jgi:hypothetical protein
MNRKLTAQQSAFLLQFWWQTKNNSVLEMFTEKFCDAPVPTQQAIYNLNQRVWFAEEWKPWTSLTEEDLTTVAQALVQSP